MRNSSPTRLVVMAVAFLAVSGCSTEQPPSAGPRTASLTFDATAKGLLFNCYDIWQDTSQPPDGIADVDTGYKSCDQSGVNASRPVPWHYSISVSIIRAGTTTPQLVRSVDGVIGSSIQSVEPRDGVPDYVSLTNYDPTVAPAPDKAPDPDNAFYFLNGKQVSVGNPIYLAAVGINVAEIGVPNILTVTPSFDFTVNRGDTVVVSARKRSDATRPLFIVDPNPNLRLAATLTVAGSLVSPVGSATSADSDSAGVSFSFTVQ